MTTNDWNEADERAAIERVVAAMTHTQQLELVDEFMELFHADATFVLATGKRLMGWDEIAEQTRKVLPGAMRKSMPVYEVMDIRFVRPDVAVVAGRQRRVTLDGAPLDDRPEGRPTYVLSKDASGVWKVAAGQNTLVGADTH